ncbi:hypothetical protein BHF71_01885 [Vulcanibacillus modesticaldus]|uniref:histidine kinase n=1 Tax=Vulcanibacillus modesticaldus TaxID=337097 RepID=A0A1D2YUL4_9BACI|nr:sensor histidine kinase [Vulcanibacillus modesticaldus]OEF99363.1 hypothetical protein BHF71_01885 [Vulcanibacillus modesticaldus]
MKLNFKLIKLIATIFPITIIIGLEYIRHGYLQKIWPQKVVTTTAVVILILGVLIFANAVFALIDRLLLEIEKRKQAEFRALATLEERERIAREMHDGICQVLSVLNLKTQASQHYLENENLQKTRQEIQEVSNIIKKLYDDVRQGIFDLKLDLAEHKNFKEVLEHYLQEFAETNGIEVNSTIPSNLPIDEFFEIKVQLIRIVQEALSNVRKHANASKVEVKIQQLNNGSIQLLIKDNGQGFFKNQININKKFGLKIMKERAESIGGKFKIVSKIGEGTSIVINLKI